MTRIKQEQESPVKIKLVTWSVGLKVQQGMKIEYKFEHC